VVSRIDEAVAALDQPSMDGINTYFVRGRREKLGSRWALSGLGGDEFVRAVMRHSRTRRGLRD